MRDLFNPDLPDTRQTVTIREALWLYIKNYFNFRGRASRTEFWVVFFALVLISAPVNYLNDQVDIKLDSIVAAVFFLPTLTLVCRRLHDIGLPGAFVVVFFIPFVGQILLLIFMLWPPKKPTADPATGGQQAPYQNRYTDPASNPDQ